MLRSNGTSAIHLDISTIKNKGTSATILVYLREFQVVSSFIGFIPPSDTTHCMLPAVAAAASFGSAASAPASDMPLRHNFIHQLGSVSHRPMRRIESCSIKIGEPNPTPTYQVVVCFFPSHSSHLFFQYLKNHLENTVHVVFFHFQFFPTTNLKDACNIFPTKNSQFRRPTRTSAGASAGSP